MRNLVLVFSLAFYTYSASADLTLYTDRQAGRLAKAVEEFKAKTGQNVNIVEASYEDLAVRLNNEGAKTPADLILVKDLVYFGDLKSKGLLQPISSTPAILSTYSFMRDPELYWVPITFRARTAVYSTRDLKDATKLTSYEGLADPIWRDKLCLRSGKHPYNKALVAFFIENLGEQRTESLLNGWLDNMQTHEFPDDQSILKAMKEGQCEIAIVNHYYFAGELAKDPQFPGAIRFLDQTGGGVHTNGAAVGLLKSSTKNREAQIFIDILLSESFQKEFSAAHLDYPAVEALQPTTFIKSWGTFKKSTTPWAKIAEKVPAATALIKKVDYR